MYVIFDGGGLLIIVVFLEGEVNVVDIYIILFILDCDGKEVKFVCLEDF